jgi:hypothetical protein
MLLIGPLRFDTEARRKPRRCVPPVSPARIGKSANADKTLKNMAPRDAFVCWFTGRREAALASVILTLVCGFFLELATSNAGIMPTFTLTFAASVLAARWFAAPNAKQVAIVGIIFTLGWLGEWRLIFPTLPALLLALAVATGSVKHRALMILVLVAFIVATALFLVNRWEGHIGAVGLPGVFWTVKGIDSGWAGFSWEKATLVAVGIGENLLGGHQFSESNLLRLYVFEWLPAFLAQNALLIVITFTARRRRGDPKARAAATIFITTFLAGEMMNAYSQPQDPQMHVNVMTWLPIIWGIVVTPFLSTPANLLLILAVSLFAFFYNTTFSLAAVRGQDGKAQATLAAIEKQFDPDRTVFVYTGWEGIVAWKYLLWTHRWGGTCDLPPSPCHNPNSSGSIF